MWRQRDAAARAARLLVLVLAVEAASAQLPSRRAGTCRGPFGMKPSPCTGAHISSVLCHKGPLACPAPGIHGAARSHPMAGRWLAAGEHNACALEAASWQETHPSVALADGSCPRPPQGLCNDGSRPQHSGPQQPPTGGGGVCSRCLRARAVNVCVCVCVLLSETQSPVQTSAAGALHASSCVSLQDPRPAGPPARGLSNRPPAGAVCVLAVCARVR